MFKKLDEKRPKLGFKLNSNNYKIILTDIKQVIDKNNRILKKEVFFKNNNIEAKVIIEYTVPSDLNHIIRFKIKVSDKRFLYEISV